MTSTPRPQPQPSASSRGPSENAPLQLVARDSNETLIREPVVANLSMESILEFKSEHLVHSTIGHRDGGVAPRKRPNYDNRKRKYMALQPPERRRSLVVNSFFYRVHASFFICFRGYLWVVFFHCCRHLPTANLGKMPMAEILKEYVDFSLGGSVDASGTPTATSCSPSMSC